MIMEKKAANFINGAAILSAAGIIVKILGAIFRIPLTNIIGPEGIGIYQLAYPMYSFLLVISSAGFPVAISRLVAEAVNVGDYKLAKRTFRLSEKLMAILGAAAMLIMILFSSLIAKSQGNPDSRPVLLAIAPAILLVSTLAAYRGYFQGLQNMKPTALSQILEQLIKLIAGLGLAAYANRYGAKWGAFGAVLGVTISEFAALVYIMVLYLAKKKTLEKDIEDMEFRSSRVSSKKIIGRVVTIAIPVAIGSAILPLVSMIDQLIVINGLKGIIPEITNLNLPFDMESIRAYAAKLGLDTASAEILQGLKSVGDIKEYLPELYEKYITSLATSLYGIMSGTCSPITALPLIFSTSIAISLVPAVSQARARRSRKEVCEKATTGFRMTSFITFPCAVGIFVLADPIIRTLYSSYSEWEILVAARCLRVMSLTVFVLPLIHTATAILQGVAKQNLPVVNLAIGALILKFPVTLICIRIPSLNILGAAIGTVLIFSFAAAADILFVKRATRMKIKWMQMFIRPLLTSAAMGLVAFVVYTLLHKALHSVVIPMGLAIICGILIYFALSLITHAIKKSDLEFLPKGQVIARKLSRFIDD